MATVKGVRQTKNDAIVAGTGTPSDLIDGQDWGAKVRVVLDNYVWAAEVVGTIVELGEIPKGARVLKAIVYYDAAGGAVTGTIKIGSVTLGSVTSMVAAGAQEVLAPIAMVQTPLAAQSTASITTGGATAGTGGDIYMEVFYTVED
jgi:hypothetical protein